MSANNWRICPKCKATAEAEQKQKLGELYKRYGTMSPGEFVEALSKVNKKIRHEESLREDWQLGTQESGEFYVSYRASCERCDFEHRFEHSEKVRLA